MKPIHLVISSIEADRDAYRVTSDTATALVPLRQQLCRTPRPMLARD